MYISYYILYSYIYVYIYFIIIYNMFIYIFYIAMLSEIHAATALRRIEFIQRRFWGPWPGMTVGQKALLRLLCSSLYENGLYAVDIRKKVILISTPNCVQDTLASWKAQTVHTLVLSVCETWQALAQIILP